jgi:hypothetical protein
MIDKAARVLAVWSYDRRGLSLDTFLTVRGSIG